jgi:hypothetical protein
MRFSALCAVSALALFTAACGERDAADAPPATQVTEAEAQSGLAALGLEEPGVANWESREYDDGVYTFTGFTLDRDEGASQQADRLIVAAPRVEDGGPAFDRMVFENLRGSADEDGAVTVGEVRVGRPGPDLARAVAASFTGEEEEEDFSDLSDLARYSFAEFSATDIAFTEEGDSQSQGGIAYFGATGFDGERLESARIENLSLDAVEDGQTVRVRLSEASIEGVGSAFFQMLAASADGGAPDMSAFTGPVTPADAWERFAVRGLEVDADGLSVRMPEITGETDEERGGAVRSVMVMDELTVEAAPEGETGTMLAGVLQGLGYDSFHVSMRGEQVYDPAADRVRTDGDNFIELREGFRMTFEQDFSGVQAYSDRLAAAAAEGRLENGEPPADVFEPLMLHSMEFRLEDQSLLERALTMAGAAQGMSAEEMRAQSAALIGMGLMMAPAELPRPFLASLSEALTRFVGEGGTLVIRMEPAEPYSFANFMNAGPSGPDLTALGLTVRAEPPQD